MLGKKVDEHKEISMKARKTQQESIDSKYTRHESQLIIKHKRQRRVMLKQKVNKENELYVSLQQTRERKVKGGGS